MSYRSKHKHDLPIFIAFINTTTFLLFLDLHHLFAFVFHILYYVERKKNYVLLYPKPTSIRYLLRYKSLELNWRWFFNTHILCAIHFSNTVFEDFFNVLLMKDSRLIQQYEENIKLWWSDPIVLICFKVITFTY